MTGFLDMRGALVALAAAGVASSGLVARDARALGQVDLELAAKGGFGTNPSTTNPSTPPNSLAFEVGGRAGVSFFGFYAGLDLVDSLGSSAPGTGPRLPGDQTTLAERTLRYGVDLGYGWKLGRLTIRPLLGVGNVTVNTTTTVLDTCPYCAAVTPPFVRTSSASNLYFEPGVTAFVAFGTVFAGVDLNALVIPSVDDGNGGHRTDAAFTVHGQVGLRF